MTDYGIGEASAATGLGQSTLRMWEQRYGFPAPRRRESGHRRYSQGDLETLKRVVALRRAGLSLGAAFERVREPAGQARSLYATLRAHHPELDVDILSKRPLLALTHAIEDETCARAERPVLFGSFQRERFYRCEEHRWREFARTSELVCVFADFNRRRAPRGAPVEIPLRGGDHLSREWSLVCDAPGYRVCLSAWEPPQPPRRADAKRVFEMVWSLEPMVVRTAFRACVSIAAPSIPQRIDSLNRRLDTAPQPASDDQLRLAAAITSRTLNALGDQQLS